ncbi:hypothetical protein EDM68_05220 [Candidatus Uhrbacteria bacterium]|nr:MAG: hypothetical protein EDM68_05220 [Candidatus Uhrbacteria bacterium]
MLGGVVAVVLILGAAAAYGVGYFVSRTLAAQSQRAEDEAAIAVLRVERGSAKIMSFGITQEVPNGGETEVLKNDEIVVSDDGRAAIVWDKHGRTLIDAGTRLRVTELARPRGESLRARLLIDIGRTWTRLERILDLDSEVSVGAHDVVATVRGTSFGVERQGNATAVKVKESKVDAARFIDRFTPASMASFLEDFTAEQTVEAGFKVVAADAEKGPLAPPVEMTQDELNDPFLLEGDRPLMPEEYDLSGWKSGAERWLAGALEYLAWRPWLLARLNFDFESFRAFYGRVPSGIRTGIESRIGAPNLEEMERLLNW